MKRTYQLVDDEGSSDTRACLDRLMKEWDQGLLIGFAYVAIEKRRNFRVNTCGEADRSPVFTRGALAVLDDKMRARIHGGKI